jgi:hypothetical protein
MVIALRRNAAGHREESRTSSCKVFSQVSLVRYLSNRDEEERE